MESTEIERLRAECEYQIQLKLQAYKTIDCLKVENHQLINCFKAENQKLKDILI